jgi:hypothetical protein
LYPIQKPNPQPLPDKGRGVRFCIFIGWKTHLKSGILSLSPHRREI